MYDDDRDDWRSLRAIRERHLDGLIEDDRGEERMRPARSRPGDCEHCGRFAHSGGLCFACQKLEDMALDDLGVSRGAES
jgi:hypothetical protein